jgi:hypothetical protein
MCHHAKTLFQTPEEVQVSPFRTLPHYSGQSLGIFSVRACRRHFMNKTPAALQHLSHVLGIIICIPVILISETEKS